MPDERQTRAAIHKRLLPLYITAFFQNFVLWYTIEKLFMQGIGFDSFGIGFMVALYSFVMLVVEVPSGILADRWSRKGVLAAASVILAISSLVGGLSYGPGVYLLCAGLWGVFFACYSGMYDSIIYDTIAESAPKSKMFDRLYGTVHVVESVALIVSALAGAFIAANIDIRATYFLAVPLCLVPVVAMLRFKEPTLHKQQAAVSIGRQIALTFRSVTTNRSLLPVVIAMILRANLIYCVIEFAQVWLLALKTPTAYYGVAFSVLLASLGVGGVLVSRLRLGRYNRVLLTLGVVLLGAIGLIVFRSTVAIVLSQAVFATGLICLHIVLTRVLHDNLGSSVRAGAASATSTFARMLIIPVALLFGFVSEHFTIYKAAYILVGFTLLLSVFVIAIARRNGRTGLESTAA